MWAGLSAIAWLMRVACRSSLKSECNHANNATGRNGDRGMMPCSTSAMSRSVLARRILSVIDISLILMRADLPPPHPFLTHIWPGDTIIPKLQDTYPE